MLLDRDAQWDYYLNLAGSQFPTMAIENMTDFLEANLAGKSLVESSSKKAQDVKYKVVHVHKLQHVR